MSSEKRPLENSILNYQEAEQQALEVRDIGVFVIRSMKGDVEHRLSGEHGFVMMPSFPITTPVSHDDSKTIDAKWGGNTFGHLPPGIKLRVTNIVPIDAVHLILPDRIFKYAAIETVDPAKLDYRWIHNVNDPVATSLLHAAAAVAREGGANEWPLLIESIGTAMAVRAMKAMGAQPLNGDVPYPDGLSPERLRRVLDFVEANLHRQISLAEMAGIAALSPFHFSRAFRKAVNLSPVKYVWRRRLELAKRMLRDPSVPLINIAIDCGFSSQSSFTTTFKRETGVTPLAYRERS